MLNGAPVNAMLAMPIDSLFFPGLAVIAFGTGFLKPNISTLVGQLYKPDDVRRNAIPAAKMPLDHRDGDASALSGDSLDLAQAGAIDSRTNRRRQSRPTRRHIVTHVVFHSLYCWLSVSAGPRFLASTFSEKGKL